MPSIHLEFRVDVPAAQAWTAFRAVERVDVDLAPGFVTSCVMDGNARLITFANGFTARELIVDVDDARRRLAYAARSERLEHHHATFQVFDEGPRRCRIAWIADVLPVQAATVVQAMMAAGVAAMKCGLEVPAAGRQE